MVSLPSVLEVDFNFFDTHTHVQKKLTSLVAAGSARTPKIKYCGLKGMQSMGPLLDVPKRAAGAPGKVSGVRTDPAYVYEG